MAFTVAIDARHIRDFGVGTYIRNLTHALSKLDSTNQYILIAYKKDGALLGGLPGNFRQVHHEASDERLSEHLSFPMFLRGLSANLYHMPLPVVPWFMLRPYIVTVHDVSRLLFEQTPGWRSDLRRYRFRRGLLRAERIIAVSDATQVDVESLLSIPADRLKLIYNAPDPR